MRALLRGQAAPASPPPATPSLTGAALANDNLHKAADSGNLAAVRSALEAGAQVNTTDKVRLSCIALRVSCACMARAVSLLASCTERVAAPTPAAYRAARRR